MKLLCVAAQLGGGGAERVWSHLIPGLAASGIDVRLLTLHDTGVNFERLVAKEVESDCLSVPNGVLGLKALPAIRAEVRSFRPTVVMTLGTSAALSTALGLIGSHTPLAINWHQAGLPLSPRAQIALRLVGLSPNLSVIAVSQRCLRDIASSGLGSPPTFVVGNGVPDPLLSGSLLTPRPASDTGGRRVILCLARLRPEKRVDRFVEAINMARRTNNAVEGLVVGDGEERGTLEALATKLKAPVTFVGEVEDPTTLLAGCDAVCLTSDFEAAPMAVLEAAALGKPVIASAVGGIPELLPPECGILVDDLTPAGFASAISQLVADPSGMSTMGRMARLNWERNHTVDRMALDYVRVLEDIEASASRSRLRSQDTERVPS